MRENGTICPFGIFPLFHCIFASKVDIIPLKRSVSGVVTRAILGVEKDKRWIWVARSQKQPKCLQNKGNPTRPRLPVDWPQISPKNHFKAGEKRQRDKRFHFRASTGTESSQRAGRGNENKKRNSFSHLQQSCIRVGQRVKSQDQIAQIATLLKHLVGTK